MAFGIIHTLSKKSKTSSHPVGRTLKFEILQKISACPHSISFSFFENHPHSISILVKYVYSLSSIH